MARSTSAAVDRDAIRICDYFDRPLVLVAWFSKCGGHCEPALDPVERDPTALPAGRTSWASTSATRRTRRARPSRSNGWGFPMAVDRDGAVGLLYGVGVGPTTFFAYPGGVLAGTALGELTSES